MFKRVTWFAAGAVAGATGSVYAQRKAREAAAKYRPAAIARNAGRRVKGRASDVVEAVRLGRTTMREREAELREQLDDDGLAPAPRLRIVGSRPANERDDKPDERLEPARRGRAGPRRRARR